MPRGNTYGRRTQPSNSTQAHFDRFGPSSSQLAQFLYPFAWRDVVFWFDDFAQNDAANLSDHYTLATDACSTAFATAAGSGGLIQGATEAASGDYIGLFTSADWFGDNNAGQEMRWMVDNIVTSKWEQGFSDPLTDNTLPALNSIDTPSITNGATDVAAIVRDTSGTVTVGRFLSDGSTACFNTTATTFSGCYTGTNSVMRATRVQIAGNAPAGFVLDANNGILGSVLHGSTPASSIEGGIALQGHIVYGTLACTAKTVTIDYWALWEDRI